MDTFTPLTRLRQAYQQLGTRKQRRYRTIGLTSAAVLTTAAVGSAATDTSSAWYTSLRKPVIQPPGWGFPLAWTALYIDIATVVGQTLADLEEQDRVVEHKKLRDALAVNLVLNTGWSILFFTGKKAGTATLEAAALAASSAGLVQKTMAVDSRRGACLLPYAAWTAFATVLSGTIWYQNR